MQRRALLALSLAASLLGALPAQAADAPGGRLERIRDTGTLVLAYRETSVPFSFMDHQGPAGFGVDVARQVADALKAQLGLRELNIRWNPVTLATRFPLMTTGTVDLECGTTTHTREREQLVDFSLTYYISSDAIAVPAGSPIRSFDDLAGKRVAVVRDTTTEAALRSRGKGLEILPLRSNALAMDALQQGEADAYVAANAIIAGEILRGGAQAKPLQLLPAGGRPEAFACMLPKGDTAFKAAVDQAIARMMQDGRMARLYDKWLTREVAPFGRAAGLPLDEANRALHAAPVDRPYN